MKKWFSIFLLLGFPACSFAADSTISKKLQGMADALARGYVAKKSGNEKESLAVLSFSSSEKLTKTKVGFAVSELLTHFFVQRPEFTVVERNLLNKLEEEQKFQAMSADTATAVKIGKLIGAKLLVLGSVEKVGGAYQTNARLVRTETGEILATAYEELPAKDFEDEAKPYLNLVPERQAIGLYAAYQYRPKAKAGTPKSDQGGDLYTPQNFTTAFYGVGMRYFPTSHVFFDIAGFTPHTTAVFVSKYSDPLFTTSSMFRASAGLMFNLSNSLRCEADLGATKYGLVVHYGGYTVHAKSTQPFTHVGFEFRPQQRVALSLGLGYELGKIEGRYDVGGTAFTLSGISVEPSLALYF